MAALDPLPDISTHPMLTPKARQMAMESPTKFAEEEALAASLLHVTQELYDAATEIDDGSSGSLDRALVLQINYNLARDMSPFYAAAESGQREGESKTYRSIDDLLINPLAARLVDEIAGTLLPEITTAEAFGEGIQSLRGRSGGRYWWDRSGGHPDPSRPYIETRPDGVTG
jgi:hypothetical protein